MHFYLLGVFFPVANRHTFVFMPTQATNVLLIIIHECMSSELKDKDSARAARFDPRMQVSRNDPTDPVVPQPLLPTINRSKHICFGVQQPHIYNCKLALMAQSDPSDTKQFGHRGY